MAGVGKGERSVGIGSGGTARELERAMDGNGGADRGAEGKNERMRQRSQPCND